MTIDEAIQDWHRTKRAWGVADMASLIEILIRDRESLSEKLKRVRTKDDDELRGLATMDGR